MREIKRRNSQRVRLNVAAARQGIPYELARQAVRRGALPAERFAGGRGLFVRLDDLEAAFRPVKKDDK